ncbi:hypothetical protein SLEP1_g52663 [Rubroshorea leprosula]|uniref:Transposase n=1 Tax=Rubroshorea leprosula TaxID=152421 RepID=A0AAV5M7X1_9ROSI|nr:hypothetical protein SLEP1_g52663 [Rubroshorea leprosula]
MHKQINRTCDMIKRFTSVSLSDSSKKKYEASSSALVLKLVMACICWELVCLLNENV